MEAGEKKEKKKRNRKKATTLSERSTRTGKKVVFFYKIVLALSFLFHKSSRPRCPKTPRNCRSAKSLSFEKPSSKPLSASLSVFFLLEGKKKTFQTAHSLCFRLSFSLSRYCLLHRLLPRVISCFVRAEDPSNNGLPVYVTRTYLATANSSAPEGILLQTL